MKKAMKKSVPKKQAGGNIGKAMKKFGVEGASETIGDYIKNNPKKKPSAMLPSIQKYEGSQTGDLMKKFDSVNKPKKKK